MKVTVVVPAHNEEALLEKCLRSLMEQKYEDYEVIVVDNSSTDETAAIAEKHADVVLCEEKKGVAFARQRGFNRARGDVIASTDADTIVDENWLNEVAQAFKEDVVGAYGPVYLRDGSKLDKWLAEYGFTYFLRLNHLLGFPNFSGQNFAVQKKAFKEVGGFDRSVLSAEDVNLALRLRRKGKISFNPRMRVYTSARRLKAGRWKFFKHHTLNYFTMVLNGRTERNFEDIR